MMEKSNFYVTLKLKFYVKYPVNGKHLCDNNIVKIFANSFQLFPILNFSTGTLAYLH